MQQGKPIINEDAVVFLDKTEKQNIVHFRWLNHDIFTEVDVYLVRNDKVKTLVTDTLPDGAILKYNHYNDDKGKVKDIPVLPTPNGRFVATPGVTYNVTYYFTYDAHVKPYNKKYPVFKFRIEMVGNPNIFAESNEFKVVY
jgi:hypothetical protein